MGLKEENENEEGEVKRNLPQRTQNYEYLPRGSKEDESELHTLGSSLVNTIIFPSNK